MKRTPLFLLLIGLTTATWWWAEQPDAEEALTPHAEGERSASQRAGPLLRGDAEAAPPTAAPPTAASTQAPVRPVEIPLDVQVEEGQSWKDVKQALCTARTAVLRKERDLRWEAGQAARKAQGKAPLSTRRDLAISLSSAAEVQVRGVPGLVTVNGTSAVGPGLALFLGRSKGRTRARVTRLGLSWILTYGCDAGGERSVPSDPLRAWQAELDAMPESAAAEISFVRIEAEEQVAGETVIAFLRAAAEAGVDELLVPVMGRKRFKDAVEDSSAWLHRHQLPDGSWSESQALAWCDQKRMQTVAVHQEEEDVSTAGLTGLCLLAYLESGYTNRGKHPFARVVSRGLRRLKKDQAESGNFAPKGTPREHLWATLAMVEAFSLTGSPIWKTPAQRGLAFLPAAWRKVSEDSLATVIAACVLGMAREVNADLVRRGKPAPFVLPTELVSTVLPRARELADSRHETESLLGTLARLMLGDDPDEYREIDAAVVDAIEYIMSHTGRVDPCLVWLTTVLARKGGTYKLWKRWDAYLSKRVAPLQRSDGHRCCLRGSFDPARGPALMPGRVATTVFLGIALGMRYLPYSYSFRK